MPDLTDSRRGAARLPLLLLLLLLAGSLTLGGCAASLAASAVGAAARAATDRPDVADDRRTAASMACEARAATLGKVQIIDAEQRSDGRVTVWGAVDEPGGRRSFECGWDREVKSFKLREIKPR
jgi:hypothetical protein